MPNPLIFLIVVLAIDLVLKSMKGKKKREQAKVENMEQRVNKGPISPGKPISDRPIRELRRILEEELEREKEKKQEAQKTIVPIEKRKTRDDLIKEQRKKISKHSELEKMKRRKEELESKRQIPENEYKTPIKQSLVAKTEGDKQRFREDILKGIIFSEVLGKPKSLRK